MTEAVGPILRMSDDVEAIVRAIEEDNAGEVTVTDRGAYVRVAGPSPLRVTRASIARNLGRDYRLVELEALMSSFSGRIAATDDEISWSRKSERKA
jgi:toluene monooxygenase system protein D